MVTLVLSNNEIFNIRIKSRFIPLNKFTKHMTVDSKKFWKLHKCKIQLPETKRVKDTPSPWIEAMMECKDLDTHLLPVVICDKRCINPLSCKKDMKYDNIPILKRFPITDRHGKVNFPEISVGCFCKCYL